MVQQLQLAMKSATTFSSMDKMDRQLDQFVSWLVTERAVSPKTVDAYRQDVGRFIEFLLTLGKNDPARVEANDVYRYLGFLSECGLAPSSIRRSLSAVRTFYAFLSAEQGVGVDPTTNVASPRMWRRVPDALTVPQVEALLSQPDPGTVLGLRDKAMLEFTYATGLRVSEVISTRLSDINFETQTVRCVGKGTKERLVPIGSIALEWIRRYLDESRPKLQGRTMTDTLFLNWRGKRLTRMGYWKILKRYVGMAGIKTRVTPHVLRHTFATHLLEGGASLRDVQQLLGHKDISTTQIYAKVDLEYLRDAILTYHPRGRAK